MDKAANVLLRYPPFPSAPDGARITPFKDFRENGIIYAVGTDGIERDGLGIPTAELVKRHPDDRQKSKLPEGVNRNLASPPPPKPPRVQRQVLFATQEWYNVWAADEVERNFTNNISPQQRALDRFNIAATEFKQGRPWPPQATRVIFIWDQFRLFSGLLVSPPVWKKQEDNGDGSDDESVSDPEAAPEIDLDTGDAELRQRQSFQGRRRKPPTRTPYELAETKPVTIQSDDDVATLMLHAEQARNERANEFLADIGGKTREFLGRWIREHGLLWARGFSADIPRLLKFFYDFLLRTGVLPEHQDGIKVGLKFVERAIVELPATANISVAFPDTFSQACCARWGYCKSGVAIIFPDEEVRHEEVIEGVDGPDIDISWDTAQPPKELWGEPTSHPLVDVVGAKYQAGVAETTLRRVKAILPHGDDLPAGLKRIVLEPWPDCSEDFDEAQGECTLLIESKNAESLLPGIGLAGTFVGLGPYTYIENLYMVLPSYYL